MEILCECNSFDCNRKVEIPFEVAKKIKAIPNSVIIVDGCSAEPTDTLVSEGDGYSVYTD